MVKGGIVKVLIIGDLHFGEHSNSEKYNKNMVDFFDWVTKIDNIDLVIQMGDYFHSRNSVNVQTLNYGIKGAKILNEAFGKDKLHVLTGNHDIYFKDRLDTHSLAVIEPYVTIVNETKFIDNILITPWIIDNEQWDNLVKDSKGYDYVFGHFEFNGFKMNDAYVMEHGNSHKELKKAKRVLSGHFHSPQVIDNVHYVGTPIPTTMSEANEAHGVYILDTETDELEFIEYTKVRVVSIPYTEIETLEQYDPEFTTVRVEFPDDLADETLITEVQEYLAEKKFDEVKIKYKGNKAKEIIESFVEKIEEVDNIDLVVKTFLSKSIEIDGVDKSKLLFYYDKAIEKEEQV
jgi:DNA repair exonuclease SbcCD nuclease subunit